jgi:hypothetical protein
MTQAPKTVESLGLSKLRAMYAAGDASGLIKWYNDGADGQINWGEDGDFQQCVDVASDYVDNPEGFCQERHIDATGEPAGKGAHGGANMKGTKQFAAAGPIPPHETPTDNSAFDKDASLTQLNPTPENLAGMHAFQDPAGDPASPKSYKFPHHNVGPDGVPAEANIPAVQDAKDAVAKDDSLTDDDKAGVNAHLDAHLADAGVAPDDGEDEPDDPNNPDAAAVVAVVPDATKKPPAPGFTETPTDPLAFTMPIMVIEGVWTGDWRFINPQSLTWRDLPLPVMVLTSTTPTHDGAQLVGQLTSVERHEFSEGDINARTGQPYPPGTTYLSGAGKFNSSELAESTSQLIRDQFLRGVSVDIGDSMSQIEMVDRNGVAIPQEANDADWDLFDLLFGFTADGSPEPDPESEPPDTAVFFGEKITAGRLMGATICPFPAFEGAYVVMADSSMAASGFVPGESGPGIVYTPSTRKQALVAGGGPIKPPTKWFGDPRLLEPTAISVTEDGRVFGHLASWTECHIGYQNTCVRAPHSKADYAYFHVGCVLTDDGSEIPTGAITMNTGHAELWQGPESAKAHYDNTGLVVADVCCGEDDHGIWIAGAIRPDADELTVRRLRGAALSGDWRQLGGSLELVAALAVNVPGFPIARPKARVASGAPMSLVAAGSMTAKDAKMLHDRRIAAAKSAHPSGLPASTDKLASITYVLERQARQALRHEVHPTAPKR